jgi:pimeloyl-ACP methyl ester carboxylesterase
MTTLARVLDPFIMQGCRGMKTNPSLFILLTFATVLLTGCSVVGVKVTKETPASLRGNALQVARSNGDSPAAALLAQAAQKKLESAERAASFLEAARITASAKPGSSGHRINATATRALVAIMSARDFAPLVLPDGKTLTVSGDTRRTIDPHTADEVVAAEAVQIRKLRVRTTQQGAGVPYVARFAPKSPALRGQPGVPPLAGLCEPVTALVHAESRSPQIVFYRTRVDDEATINGRRTELAADFSAPLAYMLSKGRNRNIDVRALIRTDENMDHAGLYQFHRYDPDKIPVVFVHGLMARPETWVPAVNELLADEQIRERYQFWFFLYPTGLPVWASAAKLRGELERYRAAVDPQRTNRNFGRIVLAGHSMGGLISSLQVRTGGRKLWKQFMDTAPQELDLSPDMKDRIAKIVEFQPRPEIARVVYFATPHRGSELAVNPFADFFARLIKLPFGWLENDMNKLRGAIREEFQDLFVAPANSVVFLRANSPLLKAILNLPMRPGVPYHSVIGDRGRGDTPNSSDGVVPYWSAHMKGAVSEKIVPSGHGAHESPEGIREFRRILHRHLASSQGQR